MTPEALEDALEVCRSMGRGDDMQCVAAVLLAMLVDELRRLTRGG